MHNNTHFIQDCRDLMKSTYIYSFIVYLISLLTHAPTLGETYRTLSDMQVENGNAGNAPRYINIG